MTAAQVLVNRVCEPLEQGVVNITDHMLVRLPALPSRLNSAEGLMVRLTQRLVLRVCAAHTCLQVPADRGGGCWGLTWMDWTQALSPTPVRDALS